MQELSRAQIRFQCLKRDEKAHAILRVQITPILKVNPRLTPTQAKRIYDRAQQFAQQLKKA